MRHVLFVVSCFVDHAKAQRREGKVDRAEMVSLRLRVSLPLFHFADLNCRQLWRLSWDIALFTRASSWCCVSNKVQEHGRSRLAGLGQ